MDLELPVIQAITNNFSEDQKVGGDVYGDVYKAVYDGIEIAVKRLHPLQGLDDEQFESELLDLSKVSHQNVVQLIGYCYENQIKYIKHRGEIIRAKSMERVLYFEYMQGGSLERYITDESCDLDWPTCYNIIRGTCAGLNHLHNALGSPLFHLNLKPANILFDKSMTPKIADLGLSRIFASSHTHQTEILKGAPEYPPEYINNRLISKKFDVFSFGVIIIKMVAGNTGYFRCSEMSPKEFIKHVSENWTKRLQAMPGLSSSHEIDILRVNTCAEIALRCVDEDRGKRPCIEDIFHELEELEAKIKDMSLCSDMPIDLIGQTSSNSNVLTVDRTTELRFLFEPRKDISTCLQLTNQTDGFLAFRVITNQAKYCTQPTKGIMAPCSKCYMSVTLRAQDEAPPNMVCNDMFVVQSARVSEGFKFTSDEIIDHSFKEGMVLDMMKLPIAYVATDEFLLYSDQSEVLIGQASSGFSILSVDQSQELRFLFEPRKDVSSCLQLTNITDGFIAFSIKTNKQKYYTQLSTGVMPPCSKCYIRVTLRAQEEAPPNMQCHDMFIVQSARVSKDFRFTSNKIADDSLKEGMVLDMMKLPIVYVATDNFSLYSDHSKDLIGQEAVNSMKRAQVPMLSYLTGSMNSLVYKLTEQKNGPTFGTLYEDLMTLKKDFDKLAGNGGVVVNLQVKVWIKEVVFDIEDWIDGNPETMEDPTEKDEKVKEFGTLIKEACSRYKKYDLLLKASADVAGLALAPRKVVALDSPLLLEDKASADVAGLALAPSKVVALEDKAISDVAGLALAPSKVVALDSPLLLGDKACDVTGLLKEHLLHQHNKLKVVSILGTGGLGKTTIAKELHGELRAEFPCGAFVYIGRNPSVRTILVNILHQTMSSSERKGYFKAQHKPSDDDFLPPHEWEHKVILEKHLDEQQVIALLWGHLSKKRYFIVLDGIWSIRYWRAISGALPDNNLGSRILTTTRIMDVAESCSAGRTDVVHHMKDLSKVESKRLFSAEGGRPADHEILKMCGGIPLAIILAAAATKYEEHVGPNMPGKSIFSSQNQCSTSEGMTKILHMIYADLSLPVRSCFLYLSVFPEGYTIKKNRLIQLWGAEGFIPEEQLWRTGESYWNELISRRLIQPVFSYHDYEAVGCTVDGVILDFIRSLSREENFSTMASELSSGSFLVNTIRRFSVDCSDEDEARVVASSRVHLSSMRSLTVFVPSYSLTEILPSTSENLLPPTDPVNLVAASKLMRVMDLFPDFKLMRVLDLEDTRNLENRHLSGIGGLVLLRYLGIGGTGIDQLPEETGKLEKLETLDLRLKRLPASIVNLENLMHLHLDMYSTGEKMSEELQELDKITNLLRYWNRLRMLGLTLDARYLTSTVPRSIVSFFEEVFRSKLQSLYLHFPFGPDELLPLLVDSWKKVTPPSDERFEPRRFELIISGIDLNGVPPNMASLLFLTHLLIKLFSVDEEVLRILGALPKLLSLNLSSARRPPKQGGCVITEDAFQCLKAAFFKGQMGLVFQKRAMPQLQMLSFHTSGGHSYVGIEQLNCLTRVHAVIYCYGATDLEMKTWEAGIREQVARNTNRPRLEFFRAYEDETSYKEGKHSQVIMSAGGSKSLSAA